MKFIHTSDWQIGKPFARVNDPTKKALLQQIRVDAIKKIGDVAKEESADFVLVAGDLFDSPSMDKATVSAACSAIGQIGIPVIAIPGNHDHGGPGSIWGQEFFQRERASLAENLTILLEAAPYEMDSAVILPCPLLRRSVMSDPTEWLRATSAYEALPADKPRIVLAHGSTQNFSGAWADDDERSGSNNLIALDKLIMDELDYVGLGDWHGTKSESTKAWYAGTPELDRFPKGGDHNPGNILVVEADRGVAPEITIQKTATFNWLELKFDFVDDTSINTFEDRLSEMLGQRVNKDLLRLSLAGSVGIEVANSLEEKIESLEARVLRLKLDDKTFIAPTEEEVIALTQRAGDPLIASVTARLLEQKDGDGEDSQVARIALRELHAACKKETV